MESYINRTNAVFCSFLISLSALALGNIVSSNFLTSPISGEISAREVHAFGYNYAVQGDQAVLTYDLKADVRGLFQWNTKQLFLFVSAEYETPQHRQSKVVVYDKIITDPEEALIDVKNLTSKYHFRDKGKGLRGRDITLKLNITYHPIVGRIYTQTIAESTFKMPANYHLPSSE